MYTLIKDVVFPHNEAFINIILIRLEACIAVLFNVSRSPVRMYILITLEIQLELEKK